MNSIRSNCRGSEKKNYSDRTLASRSNIQTKISFIGVRYICKLNRIGTTKPVCSTVYNNSRAKNVNTDLAHSDLRMHDH